MMLCPSRCRTLEDNPRPMYQRLFEGERIDNFVDGAFAFVVTLLVINGASIPHDIPSLIGALGGVPAFAAAFAQLALFWYGHVKWRDDIGFCDLRSLQLSLLLVFFALVFVYPLHMVFASFFHFLSAGLLPMDFTVSNMHDMKILFIVYGATYACMSGTLAWLFRHGMHQLDESEIDRRNKAAVNSLSWGYTAVVGLLSATIAALIPDNGPGWMIAVAGSTYVLLSFMGLVLNHYRRKLRAKDPA